MRVMPLALEIEHRIDDVLEHLRAGEAAVLGDVADEKRRHVLSLGGKEQLRGRLAHLPDAAGRRLQLQREHCLDRVDDDERRLEPRDLLEDPLETGLGKQVQRRAPDAEPLAARLDLMLRLLARAVEHRADCRARNARRPGAAASTCRCPGSPPSSTSEPGTTPPPSTRSSSLMPVEMRRRPNDVDLGVQLAPFAAVRSDSGCQPPASPAAARPFLDERVPRAAFGTAAQPLRTARRIPDTRRRLFGGFHVRKSRTSDE